MIRRHAAIFIFTLVSLPLPAVHGNETGPRTAEELFKRSAAVYAGLPAVEIVMTTSAEIPGSKPGQRVTRYLLGKGDEAVVDIEPRMRVTVTADLVYARFWGHDDRVLVKEHERGLAAALDAVRGGSAFAGLWEPPQAALRERKTTAEVVAAFRYASRLEELELAGFEVLPGPAYLVRMTAGNGDCEAKFDGTSYLLEEVEYRVEPEGAPEGYAMRLRGRYATNAIATDDPRFDFDVQGKTVVDSMRNLPTPAPGIDAPPEDILPPDVIADRQLTLEGLAAAVRDRRVLLVGESHLYEEPPVYLTALLEKLDEHPVSLLLEMPSQVQPDIERYLQSGEESLLDEIFTGRPVLQLQHLLRWARQNPKRVVAVKAIDEPMYEIRLKRSYFADTRNPTMARAVYHEWKAHPERRVVFYGGQLHMMKAGRYRFDQPSRQPAGSRVSALGVPEDEIAVVMLNGNDNFHLHSQWPEPGVLAIDGDPVRVPIAYFIDYPIFGIDFADEAFDYFVNLGPMTKIEVE